MPDQPRPNPPCPKCGSTDNWHTGHGFDIADVWPDAMPQPPPFEADDEDRDDPDTQ